MAKPDDVELTWPRICHYRQENGVLWPFNDEARLRAKRGFATFEGKTPSEDLESDNVRVARRSAKRNSMATKKRDEGPAGIEPAFTELQPVALPLYYGPFVV